MNIGEKIKKVRQLKGYKQEFLAERLGVSKKQYSMYESTDSIIVLNQVIFFHLIYIILIKI